MIWLKGTNEEERTFAKSTWSDWLDWLIKYIFKPIKEVGGGKEKVVSLFKITQPRTIEAKHVKNVYGGGKKLRKLGIQEQSEDKIIKNIRNLFKLKKNEQIKERIIRDIKTVF